MVFTNRNERKTGKVSSEAAILSGVSLHFKDEGGGGSVVSFVPLVWFVICCC